MEQITLQQIKDQYAKELGYIEWDDVDEKWLYIDEIAIRYATACCKATQEKCAENACVSYSSCGDSSMCGCMGNCQSPDASVNKSSIINHDNIVLL